MKFRIIQPNGFLKKYIKHYCFMESDTNEGNIKERVIPTENIQLMFHYKEPFVVYDTQNSTAKQPRTIISGLSNTFSDVSTCGAAGVVFVYFLPEGACHFFRFPLSEIENGSYDLSDIFNSEIKQIEEVLFYKESVTEKIAVIENFLLKNFSPISTFDDGLINKAIELIKYHKGQITANKLSDKLAMTTKSVERKFSNNIGKTPKQFIKIIRFQETLKDFKANTSINLTEYAYRNGYFDQAHFIKDFKTLSGYTPKEFISKYPNLNIE